MRPLLAVLALAVSLGAPALAAEARGPAARPPQAGMPQVGTPYDEIDATGSLAPARPMLAPDYDGPEIDVDAPRLDERDRSLREFAPE
ncbi:hypothetical protein [Methylobacterium sp. ID0610]|uniref:hypothetical protein n=1 Tax=Methylobacterium carpenticola TaxID=3344827 RepID=UPI00367C2F25